MPKYGIATILESHPVGYEFTTDNLPLHLTHVDSVVVELDAASLESKLRSQLQDFSQFSALALKDEMYGPEKDIPVTTLELNAPLKRLHDIIVGVLEKEGAVFKNPHFHKDGFKPHVSIYGPKRVQVGEPVVIKDISIAAKVSEEENANRRILATIPLR